MNSLCAFTPFIVAVPLLLTIFHYLPPRLHIYRQYMHILAYRRHSVEFASFFVCARNFLIHFVVFISQLSTVCRANKQINQIDVKRISIHIHTHTHGVEKVYRYHLKETAVFCLTASVGGGGVEAMVVGVFICW